VQKRWQEYKKLTEELKKFDKLKPAKGSNTYTAMTELGHPDAPPSYVFAAAIMKNPWMKCSLRSPRPDRREAGHNANGGVIRRRTAWQTGLPARRITNGRSSSTGFGMNISGRHRGHGQRFRESRRQAS